MVAETATSLRRGIALLLVFEDAAPGDELSVTRIAELVGREKTQVSRSLRILAEEGLLERNPETLAYRLGWRFFALAARAGDRVLLDAAPPILDRLVTKLGERAHLSVLQGTNVLTVISESPPQAVQAVGWVGRTVPVHITSSGHALLFDHSRSSLDALLARVDLSAPGRSPQDVDELWERLVAERARGYSRVEEEFEPDLVAVAAPVRDFRGRLIAAVNVSGPAFRFRARLDEAGTEVRAAAEELSSQLGWQAAPAAP